MKTIEEVLEWIDKEIGFETEAIEESGTYREAMAQGSVLTLEELYYFITKEKPL